ncbi:GDP-L-fucose synthase [Anatilimnocola aggregata]|uniref:GDP-L-fucose synthase n=1 Tax=Anatilimnocola aggregata TaxID=2528021 RepID=A0A517Y5V2_9BACT|nr:NAD(P)-dependent oxidoreductase [Anatilimnocola aggregata]QDU25502.1 GDP-L-fucose synthase [Anatilimnocola aggregata]
MNQVSAGPLVLVTGATGKVGQHFCDALLASPAHTTWRIRALCHNRQLPPGPRVESVQGSIADRNAVERALDGVTHVVHLATCKETPEDVMDVTVKGLFWLLEGCRQSAAFRQFVLIGGDAALGHFVYPHPLPVTEEQIHSAYPGCYALSKVLEEVMLEQYQIQYDLNGCCLRAPWIMEKDDFKYQLSFGEDVFGGPRWRDLVGAAKADEYVRKGRVPVMLDPAGQPVQRNFVHVSDLVAAILLALDHPQAEKQTFNICCNEPVNYRFVAEYLKETRGLPAVDVPTPYYSTWLDNAKAKFLLGWRPQYDYRRLIDDAYNFQRAASDPRKIWYPG